MESNSNTTNSSNNLTVELLSQNYHELKQNLKEAQQNLISDPSNPATLAEYQHFLIKYIKTPSPLSVEEHYHFLDKMYHTFDHIMPSINQALNTMQNALITDPSNTETIAQYQNLLKEYQACANAQSLNKQLLGKEKGLVKDITSPDYLAKYQALRENLEKVQQHLIVDISNPEILAEYQGLLIEYVNTPSPLPIEESYHFLDKIYHNFDSVMPSIEQALNQASNMLDPSNPVTMAQYQHLFNEYQICIEVQSFTKQLLEKEKASNCCCCNYQDTIALAQQMASICSSDRQSPVPNQNQFSDISIIPVIPSLNTSNYSVA